MGRIEVYRTEELVERNTTHNAVHCCEIDIKNVLRNTLLPTVRWLAEFMSLDPISPLKGT